MLGSACDRARSGCSQCRQAGAGCMYIPAAGNGRLLGALPRPNKPQNSIPAGARGWMQLQASTEFLSEQPGEMRGPEDLSAFAENPARIQTDAKLPRALRKVLKKHPDEQGEQLRLPSSELLQTIGSSIAQAEAHCEGEQPLSEHMGGGSLLAMGVLLQEYSRYLL
ncbi:hypothetical protein IWW50_001028 [Coemansia erecta]|nr:hypothetical protein GGF43_000729 [Coemansia sp. RSA 2618]KAJ2829132.1 hypothetical protein IWW50_001028 [Coemansia erecta]